MGTLTHDALIVPPPLPLATRVTPAGYYPTAYTITYDEQAKEHRIALSKLIWRN